MMSRKSDIDRWYEFALQQMAAESYLDQIDLSNSEVIKRRLLLGNNHFSLTESTNLTGATRFTEKQAETFLARYTIIDHFKNDNSGFSATLLYDRGAKEYTLSFRSTEYKNASQGGDFERDGFYGADGEIGFKGFAFGQIASMEKYFSQLKQGILSQGQTGGAELAQFLANPEAKLNITGYSLGGHLANAFIVLHPDKVLGAYLYNSAGLGRAMDGSSLASLMAQYSRILNDPASEPASQGDSFDTALKAAAIAEAAASPNTFSANLYEDPRYVWAVRAVSKRTIGTAAGMSASFTDNRITQLYGHAPHGDSEQVANSGSHVRDPIAVFIEDQPDIENWGGKWPFAPTVTEGITGDFGNTHSLTLLGDSLALARTFMALDPSLTKDKVEQILSAASNQRGVGFFGTTGVADGNSLEAALDALRKIFRENNSPEFIETPFDRASGSYGKLVNRNQFYQNISDLEQLIGTDTYSILPTQGANLSAQAIEQTNDGLAYRYALRELNPFVVLGLDYQAKHNADHSLDYAGANEDVAGMSDEYVRDRVDLLARKVFFGANDINNDYSHPINDRAEYSPRSLSANGFVNGPYYEDRGANYVVLQGQGLLVDKNSKKQIIFGASSYGDRIQGGIYDDRLYGAAGDDTIAGGASGDYLEGNAGADSLNGDAGSDTLVGGVGEDRLYGGADADKLWGGKDVDEMEGGAGRDELHGGADGDFLRGDGDIDTIDGDAGNDVIRGGTGDDILRGGLDADSYIFDKGDGNDTIDDADGLGSIHLGASQLHGGQASFPGVWRERVGADDITYIFSPDATGRGELVIQNTTGTTTVKHFKSGDLGITLGAVAPDDYTPPTTTNTFIGTAGNEARSPVGSNNALNGNATNDLMKGLAGRDEMLGKSGNDLMQGDAGADMLRGMDGNDFLFADTGLTASQIQNYIVASATTPTSGTMPRTLQAATSDWLLGGLGQDTVIGNDASDVLFGGAGSDLLVGGAGHDVLNGDDDYEPADLNTTYVEPGRGAGPPFNAWYEPVLNRNDALYPGGDDEIHAGSGDDAVYGEDGDDAVWADDGNDTVSGGAGEDQIFGGNGADRITGDHYGQVVGGETATPIGDDYIHGGAGDDAIYGDGGEDVLLGGAGNDTIYGNNNVTTPTDADDGADFIDGGDGDDWLIGDSLDDHIVGGASNDHLLGDSDDTPDEFQGSDYLDGGGGSDALRGYGGDDLLIGGAGNDFFYGDAGNDYLDAASDGDGDPESIDQAWGGDGNDIIVGALSIESKFFGEAGDDSLSGEGQLFGGDGNDTLTTHGGYGTFNDPSLLQGGNGNDRLFVLSGRATAYGEAGDDYLYGGGELDFLLGDAGNDVIAGGSGIDYAFGGDDQDTLNGGEGSDQLDGGGGDDSLYGEGGDDIHFGDEGDDTLHGGTGINFLYGGTGSDTYLRDDTGAEDFIADDDGSGMLVFGEGIDKDALAYRDGIAADGGTGYIVIEGFQAGGSVTIAGSLQSYRFADGTTLSAQDVQDRADAASKPAKPIALPLVPISGTADDDVIVNTATPQETNADAGNDTVIAGPGDDKLYGGQGNDRLVAGGGKNRLEGGDGLDTYVVALTDAGTRIVDHHVQASAETDTLEFAAGVVPAQTRLVKNGADLAVLMNGGSSQIVIDSYFVTSEQTQAGPKPVDNKIEAMKFADGTIWNSAQIAARVEGGTASNMTGTAGDDTFVVDDAGDMVTELPNRGTDTVRSSVSYTLPANVERLVLTGTLDANAWANAGNAVSYLYGNDGNNVFDGPTGASSSGGTLNAYAEMAGGKGDDSYYYDKWKWGKAVENPGEGNDTIYLAGGAGNFVLPANIENIIDINGALGRSTSGRDSLTGNALDNFLGYAGPAMGHIPYYIDGGPGADTMQGYIDNDVYVVDNPDDRVIEAPRGGVQSPADEIRSSVTYELPTNVEALTLTGAAPIDGWGNDAANTLDGSANSAVNQLYGGLGNDLYKVGDGDVVVEGDSQGFDTVEFHGSGERTYSVDDLPLFVEGIALGDDLGASNISTAGGDDILKGNASANVLVAFAGDDKLEGNGGDDTLDGGAGDDCLQGGARADTYRFSSGFGRDSIEDPVTDGHANHIVFDDSVSPGAIHFQDGELRVTGTTDAIVLAKRSASGDLALHTAADVSFADGTAISASELAAVLNASFSSATSPNADVLRGTEGDDVLNGLAGADFIYGFGGNDTLSGGDDGDWLTGGDGADTVNGGAGNDRILGGAGNDRLDGGSDDDTLHGDEGDDLIAGGDGVDALHGGTGDDRLIGDANGDALHGDAGNDTLEGGADNDYLFDLEGSNVAIGGEGDDTMYLGDGADTLNGGGGVDSLNGGVGLDTYVLAPGSGSDWIGEEWGNGDRTLVAVDASVLPADVMLTRLDGDEYDHVSIAIAATGDELKVAVPEVAVPNLEIRFGDGTVWSSSVITDKLYLRQGTAGNDTLTGTTGDDRFFGLAGNDNLSGLWGNDLLDGGTGTDTMAGGPGDDTFVVDAAADIVTEATFEGVDLVQSSTSYVLPVNVDNLTLLGTAGNGATGNVLDNQLTGNAGANALDGKMGRDTMMGGAGNDTYFIDNSGDVVTERPNEGNDTVQSSVTHTLGTDVENLTLTGASAINAVGNAANNILTGNAAANSLTGNAGDDQINGGAGADTLRGGAGNDTYTVDNASDVVTEVAGEGTDVVLSTVTYTIGANVENLTLTGASTVNATGNTLNNVLTGNAAANALSGGTGADTMIGGAGNDTYVVDHASDIVTETAGLGTDLVQSSIAYVLPNEVENLTLTGIAAINGTGNSLANTLTGNTGNNTLIGGAGTDALRGGAGNDTYVVDVATDVVTENASEGTDVVQSAVSWTLGVNVESLTLTGTSAINGTGNTLANAVTGNTGNNVLDGAAGADTLVGGAGNDTYVVDNAGDVVTEAASAGTDLVNAGVTYALAANVENLTLTGTTAANGTGNTLANTITGNTLNNVLDGGAGIDTLVGGAGNDTYVVDNAGDIVSESASGGTDAINSAITFVTATNVEFLTLTGVAAINGTGNTLDNWLRGNAAINTLSGMDGNDTLWGDVGNDVLGGNNGNDLVQGGAGNDTLSDSVGNNLLDGGVGTDTITGGSARDMIIGGAGADTVTTGGGADVIGLNKGDGADIVNASIGTDDTLTLGGGLAYSDLKLKKSGLDLVLDASNGDQIMFKNWYQSGVNNKSVLNLQVVADAMAAYNPAGADPLLNKKLVQFNFAGIVNAFDAAVAADPTITSWNLANALSSNYIAGSDVAAIGGDLAYDFGHRNALSNIGATAAQTVLGSASFGTAAQSLQAAATLYSGTVRLN